MIHKSLDIVLSFAGDNLTHGSSEKVSTFVDPVNSRKTFSEIKNINNLLVAKNSNIEVLVRDYKGNIIQVVRLLLNSTNGHLQ